MDMYGWLQLAAFVGLLLLLTKPMGLYLFRVLDGEGRTFLDPVLKSVELLFYRIFRVDRKQEQDWKQYTISLLMFSLIGLLFTYIILRLQHLLPLNPQGLGPLSPDLAFNTAASFTTNTNWQSYGGESTMSYFSQMVGLAFHNFVSAAVGISIAAALVRGIARHTAKTIGHFWVDMVRVNLYLLLPICLFYAVFLVSQGMIQNFKPYVKATLVESTMAAAPDKAGDSQIIAQGPAQLGHARIDGARPGRIFPAPDHFQQALAADTFIRMGHQVLEHGQGLRGQVQRFIIQGSPAGAPVEAETVTGQLPGG